MTQEQATWHGLSGNPYVFTVYDLNTNWYDVGGVYIFAKIENRKWVPIYIGETHSFKERLVRSHEKWDCALRRGMTHIHALRIDDSRRRKAVERDLIDNYGQKC